MTARRARLAMLAIVAVLATVYLAFEGLGSAEGEPSPAPVGHLVPPAVACVQDGVLVRGVDTCLGR